MAMNFFRKRSKQDAVGNDWKASGSFVRKPVKGWLHSDRLLESSGVTYEAKVFIDSLKIQIPLLDNILVTSKKCIHFCPKKHKF